jgi:hypothetical protein
MAFTNEMPNLTNLEKDLCPLANRVLYVCNACGKPIIVKPSATNIPFSDRAKNEYKSLDGLEYFAIFWDTKAKDGEEGYFACDITIENDPVQLRAIMYSRCRDAAYWCRPVLEKLLLGMLELVRISTFVTY